MKRVGFQAEDMEDFMRCFFSISKIMEKAFVK